MEKKQVSDYCWIEPTMLRCLMDVKEKEWAKPSESDPGVDFVKVTEWVKEWLKQAWVLHVQQVSSAEECVEALHVKRLLFGSDHQPVKKGLKRGRSGVTELDLAEDFENFEDSQACDSQSLSQGE